MSLRNGCRRMRCLAILLYLVMACALPSLAEQSAPPPQKEAAVAVLFTNDVHCYYDRDIGYDGLMLYKKELEQRYAGVLLVDAGDAIQGAPLGAISGGEEPIRLMNAVGYDVATLGNHEFDYGFDVLDRLQEELNCGYTCANFCTADGEAVYAPYKITESYAPMMDRKVGELDYDLIVRDDSGADISRNHENGLCELVADAYREVSGADVSVINAGSVRNNLMAGEVTFNDVLNVLPYSNDILIARLSGQTLWDMLEFGCRSMPAINPGFPQVSGIEFTVDIGTESTVETDENGDFLGVAGAYRVRDVKVGLSPLNPERQYTIATTSFLLGGGDHYKMLADDAEIIGTAQMADNILLAKYIGKNLNGKIPSDYRQGGRIREIQSSE